VLCQVAAKLGSDVPFFLVGGRCVGVGRGEEVYPLPDLPRRWLVILAPDRPISTGEAYAALERRRRHGLTAKAAENIISVFYSGIGVPQREAGAHRVAEIPPDLFANDFEKVVFQQFPELELWKDGLVRGGADAAMLSGSGSAIFGVFGDRRRAEAAAKAFGGFPGKVWVGTTLGRRACRTVWGNE